MEAEKLVIDIVKLIIIVGGVVWGAYRFRVEGRHKPRVEFDVIVNFFGDTNGAQSAEFVVSAENKGLRTRSFDQITLTVRGIKSGSKLKEWEKNKPRLYFPEKLIDKAELVHKKKYGSIFVEPGVTQKITLFSILEGDIELISVRAEFRYNKSKSHSSERMFRVKN